MSDLRYPVGKFTYSNPPTDEQRKKLIEDIEQTPGRLRAAVQDLSPQQLDTPYREGGWTVRQVAHHVPESHMNAYIRFKLALTEDEPTIKPYAEDRWAETLDVKSTPDRSLFGFTRFATRSLGAVAAGYEARRMEADLPPSGIGNHAAGKETWLYIPGTDGTTWRM